MTLYRFNQNLDRIRAIKSLPEMNLPCQVPGCQSQTSVGRCLNCGKDLCRSHAFEGCCTEQPALLSGVGIIEEEEE